MKSHWNAREELDYDRGLTSLEDINNLYIEFAYIASINKYIYINYVDFVLNWCEGFSISNFMSYPKSLICTHSEIENTDLKVIPFKENENNFSKLKECTLYDVIINGETFEKLEATINVRRKALIFGSSNRHFGVVVLKCINDTAYLNIRHNTNNGVYSSKYDVDNSNYSGCNYIKRDSININTKGSDIYRIELPIISKIESLKLKNSLMGNEISISTDGINLYTNIESTVLSLNSIVNAVYKMKGDTDTQNELITELRISERNKKIDLVLIHNYIWKSLVGQKYKEFKLYLPKNITELHAGGWRLFDRCDLSRIERIGTLICPGGYYNPNTQLIAPKVERLYAYPYNNLAFNIFSMNREGIVDGYRKLDMSKLKFFGESSINLNELLIFDLKDRDVAFSKDAFIDKNGGVIIKTSNIKTFKSCLRAFRNHRDSILDTKLAGGYEISEKLLTIVVPNNWNRSKYITNNVLMLPEKEFNRIMSGDNAVSEIENRLRGYYHPYSSQIT